MAKEIILPFSELKGTLVDTPNEPTLEITENGLYNVKGYSYIDVNVEGGGTEMLIVHSVITWDEATSDFVVSVTENIDDIITALNAETPVVVHFGKDYGDGVIGYSEMQLSSYYPAESLEDVSIYFIWLDIIKDNSSATSRRLSMFWDRTKWVYTEEITSLEITVA